MKLSLPTTWTQQKMSALFLLTLLQINRVKSGQGFNNCLIEATSSLYPYPAPFFSFPFANNSQINNGEVLFLCCNNSQCLIIPPSACSLPSLSFHCNRISQTIFCGMGGLCGGIVDNTPITSNTTIGNCKTDFSTMENYFISSSNGLVANSNNHWSEWTYSLFNYSTSDHLSSEALVCYWDNGGWTCYSWSALNYSEIHNNANVSCYLQWPAPFPKALASTSSSISSSFSTSSDTSSPVMTPISNNNPDLAKTIIPFGVVGVVSVSGLTYYLIRKRSKKQTQQQKQENIQLEEIPELPTNYEGSITYLLPAEQNKEFNDLAETEAKNEQYLRKPEEVYFGKPQEESLLQKPHEQYQAQVEVAGLSRFGGYPLH